MEYSNRDKSVKYTCLCMLCSYCGTDANVEWCYASRRPSRVFTWPLFFCRTCKTRWTAWHWLEDWTGISWRRVYDHRPEDDLAPAEIAALIATKERLQRGQAAPGGYPRCCR